MKIIVQQIEEQGPAGNCPITGISEATQWQDSGNAANTRKLKEQKCLRKDNSSLLDCLKSKHK